MRWCPQQQPVYVVQPVDVVFNALFKAAIDKMATAHLQENLDDYMQEKIKKASLHKVSWSSREDILSKEHFNYVMEINFLTSRSYYRSHAHYQ